MKAIVFAICNPRVPLLDGRGHRLDSCRQRRPRPSSSAARCLLPHCLPKAGEGICEDRNRLRPSASSGTTCCRTGLRRVLLALLGCLLLLPAIGCDWPGKPNPAERPVSPENVLDFKTLFGELRRLSRGQWHSRPGPAAARFAVPRDRSRERTAKRRRRGTSGDADAGLCSGAWRNSHRRPNPGARQGDQRNPPQADRENRDR